VIGSAEVTSYTDLQYYGSDFAGWGGDFDLGADHGCELSLVYRYKVAIGIKWTQ